jgi:hypothetical protein
MYQRNFMRLALNDDSGVVTDEDPITGESVEAQAERTPEEDAQAAVEASEDLAEAQQTAAELQSMELRALRLEDAAEIIDSVPEADTAHIALARTVADLATDGDDEATVALANPDGVSVESMRGRKMTTEGFKDGARRIWDAIKAFVKKLWAKIEGFFYKHFGRIPRMRKTLKAASEALETADALPMQDKKIDITTGTSQMVINNEHVKDFSTYTSALAKMKVVCDSIFTFYGTAVKESGEKITDAISDFDPDNGEAGLMAIATAAVGNQNAPTGIDKARPPAIYNRKVEGDRYITYSEPLPGNICLGFSTTSRAASAARTGGEGAMAMAMRARNHGVYTIRPEKPKEAQPSVSIPTPSTSTVRDAISTCEDMLTAMEGFYRGSNFKKIKENNDKLSKASETLSKRVDKINTDDKNAQTLTYCRQALMFNSSYAQRVLDGFTGVSTVAMGACSFVAAVAHKVRSAHREKA